MKTKYGFTLFENIKEFKEWLDKQNVKRKITRLQVHMMDEPNYKTWETTDKKVYGDNRELGRTQSLDSYGKSTWNYSDGHGHYIAEHFNVFPNGKITTGRSLESTPVGIKGRNTNAICIEIYGCFDKGRDIMTDEQKDSVIAMYSLLADKFNIPKNSNGIRPHCWFTAGGTYLGGYSSTKSAKTCPGTNFMGFGNTKKDFDAYFYPMIQEYKYKDNKEIEDKVVYNCQAKVVCNEELNVRAARPKDGVLADIKFTLPKDTVVQIGYSYEGWCSIYTDNDYGYVNKKYLELV